jgi:hypothetical protein
MVFVFSVLLPVTIKVTFDPLSDNETLIPHLLLNLEIDVIKQVLKSSVGLALFDDYKGANVTRCQYCRHDRIFKINISSYSKR